MTEKEIDRIINSAEQVLQNLFLDEIRRYDLENILLFCFPFFDVNVKQKKYFFYVNFDFDIVLNQNLFWENKDGNKRLISIDEVTRERKVVISISYESQIIFKAYLDFDNLSVPIVSQHIEKTLLIEVIKSKKLVINETWEDDFS